MRPFGAFLGGWPVGDKIGSPRPPVDQGEPGVSLTQGSSRLTRLQGGVTLGPEQGELGANFCYLGLALFGAGVEGKRHRSRC
jgi:hypothetical protein